LYPDKFAYDWAKNVEALSAAFPVEKYKEVANAAGITGSIFMEVDVNEEDQLGEAQFFLKMSEDPANGIMGVIASGRPEKDGFSDYLDEISHPALKGIRRVMHVFDKSPIGEILTQNVRILAEKNLVFDICALPRQLPDMVSLVGQCSNTRFVLDHCGKPPITSGDLSLWKKNIVEMASYDNVCCKVSGLVDLCSADRVNRVAVQPVFDHVLENFGSDRIIFGGDWPICELSSSLGDWVTIAGELVAPLSLDEKENFWSGNAIRTYNL